MAVQPKVSIARKVARGGAIVAVELVLFGISAMIDPDFTAANAHWFLLGGIALFVALWFYEQVDEFILWKRGSHLGHSPIKVANYLNVDCSAIEDENSNRLDSIEAMTFSLIVYNDNPTGETLRHVQAHAFFTDVDVLKLRIREDADGKIDLRHGERAMIEIGSIYVPSEEASGMRTVVPHIIKASHVGAVLHNAKHGHYSLHIAEYLNQRSCAIAATKGLVSDMGVFIAVSADNVISREVRLRFRNEGDDIRDWLNFESKKND